MAIFSKRTAPHLPKQLRKGKNGSTASDIEGTFKRFCPFHCFIIVPGSPPPFYFLVFRALSLRAILWNVPQHGGFLKIFYRLLYIFHLARFEEPLHTNSDMSQFFVCDIVSSGNGILFALVSVPHPTHVLFAPIDSASISGADWPSKHSPHSKWYCTPARHLSTIQTLRAFYSAFKMPPFVLRYKKEILAYFSGYMLIIVTIMGYSNSRRVRNCEESFAGQWRGTETYYISHARNSTCLGPESTAVPTIWRWTCSRS